METNLENVTEQRSCNLVESFPDEALWIMMHSLTSPKDRNSASLACKRIYEMDKLQRTHLKVGCGLHPARDAIFALCKRFTQLTTVEITYSGWLSSEGEQIDDNGLYTLASECKHLTKLTLSFCGFLRDPGFASLGYFGSKIKTLCLNFIPGITGRGLLSLVSGCQSITTLQLIRCMQVKSTEWLELLGRKRHLKHLCINYCKFIQEMDLAKFRNGWKKLQEFNFKVDPTQRYMEAFVLKPIQPQEPLCTKLKILSLTNCVAIPGKGLAEVLVHSKSLQQLHLDMCSGIRDHEVFAMKSTKLQTLSLRVPFQPGIVGTDQNTELVASSLTDASLNRIAYRCPQLEEVSISFVDGVAPPIYASLSMVGILAMVHWCLSLRVMVLDRVYTFTDSCMEVLCTSRSLQTLQLTLCPELTNVGIQHIAQSHLKNVSLFRCLKITNVGFVHLVGSQKLLSLRVEGCPAVSETGILGVARDVTYKKEWMR